MRRAWLVAAMVLLLAASVAATLLRPAGREALLDLGGTRCADRLLPADQGRRPFDTAHPGEGDRRLARLVRAASGWGLGRVAGAVGYDHEEYVSLLGLETTASGGRLGMWLRRDPVLSVLGPDLRPRWALRAAPGPHWYDAGAGRFVQLAGQKGQPGQVAAYDVADGRRLYCARLGRPLPAAARVATAVGPAGGVRVLVGGPRPTLTALDPQGHTMWSRRVRGVDRAGYLGLPEAGLSVAGGRGLPDLAQLSPASAPRVPLSAYDARTGRPRWRAGVAPGTAVAVVGEGGGTVVAAQWGEARGARRVVVRDRRTGRVVAHRALPPGPLPDLALRGDVLLLRTPDRLRAWDSRSLGARWSRPIPRRPQAFPYGFELDAQPMLDARHLLLGATSALVELDLRDGSARRLPLPTDGISTTFWPYQLAAAPGVVALATNTGAVVLRR